MRRLQYAFQFLTRFSSRAYGQLDGEDISKSTLWYPLVAAIVGALCSSFYYATSFLHVPYFAALCWTVGEAACAGAANTDGFASACDAFLCKADTDTKLRILEDRRLGTLGVLGIAFMVGAKVLLLGSLPAQLETAIRIIAVPVCGKAGLMVLALTAPSAPSARGSGADLLRTLRTCDGLLTILLCAGTCTLLAGIESGLLAVTLSALCALVLREIAANEVGGATGKVLGAANELGEVLCLLMLCVLS